MGESGYHPKWLPIILLTSMIVSFDCKLNKCFRQEIYLTASINIKQKKPINRL